MTLAPASDLACEGGQESVTEGLHGPGRRPRAGPQPVLPSPPGDPVQYGAVAGDDRDRDVHAGVVPGDEGGGLVVAEDDKYQIVIAVVLHVRHEGGQRVLDGTSV